MATTQPATSETTTTGSIDALLQEDRRYAPSDEFKAQANWNDPSVYQRAEADPEAFWAEQAKAIDWFKPWDKVLEWDVPWAKWFVGAQQSRHRLRRRAGRYPRAHLSRPVPRGKSGGRGV